MTLYTLRICMADGSEFSFTEEYNAVSYVRIDIQEGRWVCFDLQDEHHPTRTNHMSINPAQVVRMEMYSEKDEVRKGRRTFTEERV